MLFYSQRPPVLLFMLCLEFFYSQKPRVLLFPKTCCCSVHKSLEFFYLQKPGVLLFTKTCCSFIHKSLKFCPQRPGVSSVHKALERVLFTKTLSEFFYSQRPAVLLITKASSSSIYKNLEFF